MSLTIGVDVGGTKIAAGVVDDKGDILAMVRKPTPADDAASVLNSITEAIEELRLAHDISAIGVGAPGFIDNSRSSIIFAPNIRWRNEPLAMKLSTATGLPVVLENDANAAAWGEFKYGAARGRASVAVVTVGTGIGGGIVDDGHLLRGSFGFAGEIGHINMVPDGHLCGCGENGCWEMYSSGNALVRLAKERAKKSPATSPRLLELAGGNYKTINGLMVTQAAQDGDPGAIECFNEIGKWLGQGMADLAAVMDPEVFVLAGGVSEAGSILLNPARTAFELRLTARTYRPLPPILLAQLGNDAGIIGAADLARDV